MARKTRRRRLKKGGDGCEKPSRRTNCETINMLTNLTIKNQQNINTIANKLGLKKNSKGEYLGAGQYAGGRKRTRRRRKKRRKSRRKRTRKRRKSRRRKKR